MIVEGIHAIREAIDAGADIERVLVGASIERDSAGTELVERVDALGIARDTVSDPILASLQDARTPRPLLAVVRRPTPPPEDSVALHVITCDVQDPGNLGSIVRTSTAAGAGSFVAGGDGADPYHPRAIRASAGAAFRIPPRVERDVVATIERLRDAGTRIVGADAHAGTPHASFRWTAPTALVFGSEAAGIPDAVRSRLHDTVRIDIPGPVESLSVGAAAAVLLFAAAGSGALVTPLRGRSSRDG